MAAGALGETALVVGQLKDASERLGNYANPGVLTKYYETEWKKLEKRLHGTRKEVSNIFARGMSIESAQQGEGISER